MTPVRFRWFDAALLGAAALLSMSAAAAMALAPKRDAAGVAVIFAPWTAAEDSLSRAVGAGGRFVRFGGLEFVAVVEPEAPDYAARARANGAWLIADPVALAACLKPFVRNKS